MLPFIDHHLLRLIKSFNPAAGPLDLYMSNYFRQNKALGSKDRAKIAEEIYRMIRWLGLIDALCVGEPTWEERLKISRSPLTSPEGAPPHVKVSFPQDLFERLASDYGQERAEEICRRSNLPAKTCIRANLIKTTREALLERWSSLFDVSPCKEAEAGILFNQKAQLTSLPEFREGLFEMQDEGSQLIGALVEVKPGEQVLDYCAGSGGKTLAFAHRMQGSGQIYLHDIRPWVLQEAKKRLKRAGVQNAQLLEPENSLLPKLKKKMDWVLVDVPCTGTGTLRRNPDSKWRYSEEMLSRLIGQQRVIFEKALSFLKEGGQIVFATCSLLKAENEKQLEHFLKTYPLELVRRIETPLGDMDGFFGVVLQSKKGFANVGAL